MQDNLTALILECIGKYEDAELAVAAFESLSGVRYPNGMLTSFDQYLFHVFQVVSFRNLEAPQAQTDCILSRMTSFYEALVECNDRTLEVARRDFERLSERYQATVVPEKARLLEARDGFNLEASTRRVGSLVQHARCFSRRKSVDEGFIRSNWDDHFKVFRISIAEIEELNGKMTSTLEKVKKALAEEERTKISQESLALAKSNARRWKYGFIVAIIGLLVTLYVNFLRQ